MEHRSLNNQTNKIKFCTCFLTTHPYPLTGSTTIALGFTKPVSKRMRRCRPSSLATSILSSWESVQKMLRPRWSTAIPSGLPKSAAEQRKTFLGIIFIPNPLCQPQCCIRTNFRKNKFSSVFWLWSNKSYFISIGRGTCIFPESLNTQNSHKDIKWEAPCRTNLPHKEIVLGGANIGVYNRERNSRYCQNLILPYLEGHKIDFITLNISPSLVPAYMTPLWQLNLC